MLEKLRVAQALEHGRQALLNRSTTPNLDAQLLLMKAVNQTRAWVLAYPEAELSATQARQFQQDLAELAAGTALPYLLGWWEFYGRRFKLNRRVLIPRPETELLVEQALSWLQQVDGGRALDLGTGSGCLAVTLAVERPGVRVWASDIEREALQLARLNASWYGVQERISFVQGDLLSPFGGPFDVICANLPYIPTGALADLEVARREPAGALDGGQDGLSLIRRALEGLPRILGPRGLALFEIQPDQASAVSEAARWALPGAQVQVRRDLAGLERLFAVNRVE